MRFKSFGRCAAALVIAVGLSSCGGSSGYAGTAIAFSNGSYSATLVEAKVTSLFAEIYISLEPAIVEKQLGKTTLFAPSNAAIEKYLTEKSVTIGELIARPKVALQLVLDHLFEREISATELLNMNGESLVMLNGSTYVIDTSSGSAQFINGDGLASTLIAIDLVSTDGVVHIVDTVLQP